MDEDGDVQNGIGVEVAQTNNPEFQQIPQKWMNRKSQPAPKIILEYHCLVSMRCREGFTERRLPSGGGTVRKNAGFHQSVQLCLSCSRRHPLFIAPGYGARLLGTSLFQFRGSSLRHHLPDLVRVSYSPISEGSVGALGGYSVQSPPQYHFAYLNLHPLL